MKIKEPFYFVWNPRGNPPSFRHETEHDAIAEAERLARLYPGEEFIVLESVCSRVASAMVATDLRPGLDIPF